MKMPLKFVKQWRLLGSLADHHELHQLELSWFRMTTCSSRTHRIGEETLSLHCLSLETKAKDDYVKKLKSKLQLDNVRIVPQHNIGGRLALFWKNEINISILDSSPSHIDAMVNPRMDDAWRIRGFYENPVIANKEHSWALLKHLILKLNLPWLCMGDFNEIVKAEEKMGGALQRE